MKYKELSISEYVKALSSKAPTPGGGSAAAVTGAMAISLSLMVARIMQPKIDGRKQAKWKDVIKDLEMLKRSVAKVIDDDPKCYQKVMDAYSLPKADKRRDQKIQKALMTAYESMRNLAVDLCSASVLNKEIGKVAKGAIANDLQVSGDFLQAAFSAAISTARINVIYIAEDAEQKRLSKEIAKLAKVKL